MTSTPIRVAVFASGSGTTLQALLDHTATTATTATTASAPTAATPWRVRLVVSDRPNIGALDRAIRAGVPTRVIAVTGRSSVDVATDTLAALTEHDIQAICLAGYLRLVPASVVAEYEGCCLNVHPALLPSFGGKGMYGDRVHGAVLASGTRISGPTVHLVDEEYDRGTPLAQWPIPVLNGDTVESLRARVQAAERALYPLVVDRLAAALAVGDRVDPLDLAPEGFRPAGDPSAVTVLGPPTTFNATYNPRD